MDLLIFTLRNANNNLISSYYETNDLPREYISDAVYEKKYDLSAGTYYIKVNAPVQGKFQLKIGSDELSTQQQMDLDRSI